ncbi:hypothetical protein H7K23_05025, partial [Paracoccus yeei]|nr:hypothetical protein [Paracoccus yeei]
GAAASQAVRIEAALTPEGFDPARLREIVAASALPEARKAELAARIDAAAADPAAVPALLDQIKTALP